MFGISNASQTRRHDRVLSKNLILSTLKPEIITKMKIIIIFLFVAMPALVFGQMKREVLQYNGIQYLKYTPTTMPVKGAILFLHGMGERGTNISLLENLEIPKQLKNGLEVPYIVVAPQLPSSMGGWWSNITYPIIEMMKTYNLDLHLTGLSLGAMSVPALISEKPGVFKTASTVCGKVEGSIRASILLEMGKIPSIHYYDPADGTISYGYSSVKSMVDELKLLGKDINLVVLTGSPNAHTIWPQAYATTKYWQWLASKTSATPTPPPVATAPIDKQYRVGNEMFIESGGLIFKVILTPNSN
jgi:predicted peptidase